MLIKYKKYTMSRNSVSVLLLAVFVSTSAYAGQQNVEALYQNARSHYYDLFSSPEKMKQRRQWLFVISKFSNIVKTRPRARRAVDAQYTIGLLYKNLYYRSGKLGDKSNAISSFNKVISGFPKSSLVDDARRHIGDIRFRDSEYARAAKAYKSVSRRKSDGRKIRRASSSAGTERGVRSFAKLTQVRRFSHRGYTRIILRLSRRTAFRTDRLSNPNRVFVDLLGTRPSANISKTTKYSDGMVRSIRMGQNSSSVTRVVFDLASNPYHSVTSLMNPFRIVIDFGRQRSRSVATKPKQKRRASRGYQNVNFTTGESIRTIVIDPGHGGKDPGAVGPTGLKEKNVTLAISKKLKRILGDKCRCKVILTRNSDRFVELDDRTVLANSYNADLFISIHVNSNRNRRARGIETYFLSPARSKDALATAARENMLAMKSSNPETNDLAYIMNDMASTQKVNDSYLLATNIQRSMVKGLRRSYHGVKDKGVKQAMFYVLWRATMPSVLVETSFISNRSEERKLRSSSFQRKLAESIATGIGYYSKTYTTAMR